MSQHSLVINDARTIEGSGGGGGGLRLFRPDNEILSEARKFVHQNYYYNVVSYIHIPLNAGAKRSGATCHMAMPQCCYLAKGAKRPEPFNKYANLFK